MNGSATGQEPLRFRPDFAAVVLCTAVALALSGCTRRVRIPYAPGAGDYVLESGWSADRVYEYRGTPAVALAETAMEARGYAVSRLTFPSIGSNGQAGDEVEALYYRSELSGLRKLVVVLPIWGTHTYPPAKTTEGYARHSRGDAHIVRVLGRQPLIDWELLAAQDDEAEFVRLAAAMTNRVRATVVDISRLIDWAEARPEIDASRIGLVGFSMGALVAAMNLGNEPRIAAAVLMMGGARPGDIFTYCAGRVRAVRENALQRLGWTEERYRAFFSELFEIGDPVRYSGRYDPAAILMIDAARDDCVPGSSREALWQALGRPERISLQYPHKQAFLSMTPLGFNYSRRKIFQFLDEHL